MANTTSAEKRNRQAQRRRTRNSSVRSTVRTAVKNAREAFAAKDPAQVKDALAAAIRQVSRAASKGVLHKRNAARRISRLMKQQQKVTPQA